MKTVESPVFSPWQMPESLLCLDHHSHDSLHEKNGPVVFKSGIPQAQCCQCTLLLVSHACQASQGPAIHSVTVLGTQPPSSMKNFLS